MASIDGFAIGLKIQATSNMKTATTIYQFVGRTMKTGYLPLPITFEMSSIIPLPLMI